MKKRVMKFSCIIITFVMFVQSVLVYLPTNVLRANAETISENSIETDIETVINVSENDILNIEKEGVPDSTNKGEVENDRIVYDNANDSYKAGPYYKNLLNVVLTGNQRDDIVAVAQSQVGYLEGGNNADLSGTSKNHRNYTEYGNYIAGNGGSGMAWCAMFVAWCARKAEISEGVIANSKTASASKFGVNFYSRGSYTPQKGDLIIYDWKGNSTKWDHIGIVEKVDSKNVYTIEGNSGSNGTTIGVVRKKRSLTYSEIKGYGVPNYQNTQKCAEPQINISDMYGAKKVKIDSVDGSTIYYSVNNNGMQVYNGPFNLSMVGTQTVTAYAQKSGYAASSIACRTFGIQKSNAPVISKTESSSGVVIKLDGSKYDSKIWYSVNGSQFQEYKNSFTLQSSTELQYFAQDMGCASSDFIKETITISRPGKPNLSVKTENTIVSQGDQIVLGWEKIFNASSYDVKIYQDGQLFKEESVNNNSYTFYADEIGEYSFSVCSNNIYGKSEDSNSVSISVKPYVTIVFEDWDGTKLSDVYTVKYGTGVQAPKSPSREGYDFQGWSKNYTNITEDTVVVAQYEKKAFNITFCNQDGAVISKQKVEWGDAAKAPEMSAYAPIGYVFSGWHIDPKESECDDYTNVKGKMKLYATYTWENINLPVLINTMDVVCDSNSSGQYYSATVGLFCSPTTDIRGRIVVEIQTEKGRTIAIGTQDIVLSAGVQNIEETIKINSSLDGTIANAYVIGIDEDENSAGAYSKVKSCDVSRKVFYSEWSEWSTSAVSESENVQVETKKQYRYNTKSSVTSTTSNSIDGYTLISTTTNVGNWSAWSDTQYSAINSVSLKRDVNQRSVATSTSYEYAHYCTGNVSGAKYMSHYSNNSANATFNANCVYHSIGRFDSSDSRFVYDDGSYLYYPNGSKYNCSNSCWRWYRMNSITNFKNQYQYRDTTYQYYFEKVSAWTEWEDVKPQTSYNALQERTLYRYRTVADKNEAVEIEAEETYPIKGIVKDCQENLEGKHATVFVYKRTNTDPTQSQIEFMDQIVLGTNNSYEFTVAPKEVPSEDTGDFIVSLAIEGSSRLVNVDVISAPKPFYTVSYYAEGECVSEQSVKRNENAKIPNAPVIDGKKFVRWDTSSSNITEDTVIQAIYNENEYVVVYIDNLNNSIEIKRASHNDPIGIEVVDELDDGYTFKGWDKEYVTGDTVTYAVYEKNTYTVTFKDVNDNEISVQNVEHGKTAIPPDVSYLVAPVGTSILGWSKEVTWWNVNSDMVVYPIVTYGATTSMPYSDTNIENLYCISNEEILFEGEEVNNTIELKCDTENSQIYYTTDGSDPIISSDDATTTYVYDEPIKINGETVIKACAISENRNMSETVTLVINPDSIDFPSEYGGEDYVDVTSIQLNLTKYTLEASKTFNLTATLLPQNATNKNVIWSSSDTKIAIVDSKGKVTANSEGVCEIIATSEDNSSISTKCIVTVKQNSALSPIKVSSIKLSGVSKKIAAGKKIKLSVDILPANADNNAIEWKTSNKKYATVSSDGVVSVKKAGAGKKVKITAEAKDGSGVKAEYEIKIMKHKVTSIKLKVASKSVKNGKNVKVQTTIKTTGKKVNKKIKWTSSNSKYATVNSKGVVKTKRAGKGKTVVITATSTDGTNKKAKIKIKIK